MKTLPAISYIEPGDPWYKKATINSLEVLSGRRKIEAIYHQLKSERLSIPAFFERAMALGGVETTLDSEQFKRVPGTGPLVFVANHPFGILDGLIMCHIAAQTRGEFKILLHSRLCRDDQLEPYFLPVSFEETQEAIRENVVTKREAERVLQANGTIVIFPAGGVATRGRFGLGELEDLPWSTFVAKIVAKTRAAVVPVYFHGENSRPFHFVSGFSQTLRLALLMKEVINKMDSTIHVEIGDAFAYETLERVGSRKELTRYLYEQTFALGCETPTLAEQYG